MTKFEAVQIGELKKGDRFYFAGSSNKAVWEVDHVSEIRVDASLVGGGRIKKCKAEAPVIFLTSKQERFAL